MAAEAVKKIHGKKKRKYMDLSLTFSHTPPNPHVNLSSFCLSWNMSLLVEDRGSEIFLLTMMSIHYPAATPIHKPAGQNQGRMCSFNRAGGPVH